MQPFFHSWVKRDHLHEWLTLPPEHLNNHGLIVGQPRSGKTESLLRLAALARKYYHWQVIYLDLKGEEKTQRRFVACMRAIPNTTIRTFPASYYDAWRGDADALFNRLLAVQTYSEEFYESIATKMLRLAIDAPLGVPRNSKDFVSRLDLDTLRTIYQDSPEISQLLDMSKQQANGTRDRYWSFFAAMRGRLDGDLAYEDADAIYLKIDGLGLRKESKILGRFLLEDFANYVPKRKPRGVQTLFLVDEINTLDLDAEGFGLFEKARSYGASVIASSQTYEALGDNRERIEGASHLILLHRCPDPEELIKRAGQEKRVTSSWGVESGGQASGRGNLQLRAENVVDPTEVKRLATGEAFVFVEGRAQKVRMAQMQVTDEQLTEAERFIDREQARREQRERQAQTIRATQQAQPEPDDVDPEEM